MSFLKNLFGSAKLDGNALAQSQELKQYAQIALLTEFLTLRPLHDAAIQARWSRVLPKPYLDMVALFEKQGWLAAQGSNYAVTPAGQPFADSYRARAAQEKAEAIGKVHDALLQMMTSEALTIRRNYENHTPLGKADWSGPEPQMSHSAVTRRIFFLEHWLLDDLSPATVKWLKIYAAEQHLWGASWLLPAEQIPAYVQQDFAESGMPVREAAFWKAAAMGLYVDNQETWQRCKGGDHVRRIEIIGPNDEFTCEQCRPYLGKQFLVVRVPELPHRACTSQRGCRCRYEPVLEVEEIPLMA